MFLSRGALPSLCRLSPITPRLRPSIAISAQLLASSHRIETSRWRSQTRSYSTKEEKPKSENTDPKGAKDPRSSLFKDLKRLFRLAKPEYGLLAGALLCLVGTSTVSMTLPFFIGKIIDTTKDDENEKESGEKPVESKKILGLTEVEFYSGLGALLLCGSLFNFGRIYLLRSVGEKMVARLRSRLFAKTLSQDSYFFDVGPTGNGMNTGDLISRLSSDTQIISKSLSGNVSDGARSLISGIVGLSMMCWVSWKLSLVMSLMFPPLILSSTYFGRRVKELSRSIQNYLGGMTKVAEEKFNGLKTIQSFAQQKSVTHDFNAEVKHIFNKSMTEGKLSGIYYSMNGFVGNITIIGLLVVGTRLISSGDITIGDLSSFMMYALYTGSSVFGLGNFYTELMKGIGAAERIFELVDSKPQIPISKGRKVDSLHGDVELRNVKFSYPSRRNVSVFQDMSIKIKKGEHVCFVGPSGSGKSTISQLLLRFYDPDTGQCLVNGHNIRDLNLNFYRSNIGYVQQDPLLFSGTIRDNIVFGKRDATPEDIEYATRLSNAQAFIQGFPKGLDTVIGPTSSGSAQLSGGQRQRLSLARTLIKRPNILILDEATSALDSRSEEIVMKNLGRLTSEQQITVISIAHRLSTIKNSKRIIVLNSHGEIVEDGEFDVLYADEDSRLNRLLKSDLFSEEAE